MRFVGHHCLIEDQTRVHELEQRLAEVVSAREREPRRLPVVVAR
jgi:hypothetical protein